MLSRLLRDVRYGMRQLRRQPAVTAVGVLSLALGIGLNTTLFSVVNAVLFKGGHIAAPERLVEIYTGPPGDIPPLTTSYPDLVDFAGGTPALQAIAGHGWVRGILSGGDRPALMTGEAVTANYFDVLGIRIPHGRGFVAAEAAVEGGAPVVVLSHTLWQQQFGGRPMVGAEVNISGHAYTVIGVAPAGYAGAVPGIVADFWVPVTMVERLSFSGVQWNSDVNPGRTRLERRGSRWLFVKGRLAEGRTVEQAREQVEAVMARLANEYPGTNDKVVVTVLPAAGIRFHPMLDGYVKAASAGVLAAVALVLIIACANVANLLLARGAARQRELAIRTAVGATRSTIVAQLLTEALVLSALGGGLGLVFAWWAGSALSSIGTDVFPIPVRFEFVIDRAVLTFTAGAAMATAIVFGLLPALSASRPDIVPALKDETFAGPRPRRPLQHTLVIGQLALSLVLLSSGALLARGLFTARHAEVGFDPSRIASLSFNLQMNGYDEPRATALRDRAIEALRGVSGVTHVSYASRLPLSPDVQWDGVRVPTRHDVGEETPVDVVHAGPGYFEAVGVPLVAGRGFSAEEAAARRHVAIVNETMARMFWPEGHALGAALHVGGPAAEPYEVVGIARDHKVRSVGEPATPYLHLPAGPDRNVNLIVRAAVPVAPLLPAMRAAILDLEPTIVFTEDVPATAVVEATMAPTRLGALFVGAFGVLALLLAAVGLYGVITHGVSRRTREMGIRMAVGATRLQVLRLVLMQGLRLALFGIMTGTLGALISGRLLESMLYGVSPADPIALSLSAGTLLAVAVAANVMPARAASRIDPLRALRSE